MPINNACITGPDDDAMQLEMSQVNTLDGFTLVKGKAKRNKRRPIGIQGTSTNISSLRGAKKKNAFIHVYNLDTDTTAEMVVDMLRSASCTNVTCTALQSKRPADYASFKLELPMDQAPCVMQADLWPIGVRVKKFFHPQHRRSNLAETQTIHSATFTNV